MIFCNAIIEFDNVYIARSRASVSNAEFPSLTAVNGTPRDVTPQKETPPQRTMDRPPVKKPQESMSLEFAYYIRLARSACSRYAGCEHFVSSLGESYLAFYKFRHLFIFTNIRRQRTN